VSAPAPLERIATAHAGLAPRLAGGASWDRRRQDALERLLARGLPERRDENWKYLDHARLGAYSFGLAADASAKGLPAPAPLPLASLRRVTLLDGRYEPALSDAPDDGVVVEGIAGLIARDPGAALGLLRTPGDDPDDRFALLADAFTADGVLIRVAAGAAPATPVCLTHLASAAAPGTHHARLCIELGPGARLVLVERFVTAGPAAVLGNLAAELSLGRDATLVHVRLHEQGAAAAQVETWVARQDAGSRYEQYLFAAGGAILRSNLRLALAGEAAACRLLGLFAAEGERQVDLHTQVTHEAPATRTEQECRGIARDRGRGAFNGRIVVQPAARGADASQSIRNLLLSPLAEINARPQLEIHVDDVRCRHGATVGSLDEAQHFYLRSRGLDPAAAAALLTWAFCADLIGRLPLPELRAAMQARFAAALPDRALLTGSA
jgi:Fe-S cluster assembly protein SufD